MRIKLNNNNLKTKLINNFKTYSIALFCSFY